MESDTKIPTLFEYIEETKNIAQETPIKRLSFVQKISWTFYIFSFVLAFLFVPLIFESFFSYHSIFLNIFSFIFFTYITYEFRKSILPKKEKIKKSISQDYNLLISLLSNYGFSNTSNDIEIILKYSHNVFQLNKEYIVIIDEALNKYIKTIVKISNLSYRSISNKNLKMGSKQSFNLNSQEVDGKFLKHIKNISKSSIKSYKNYRKKIMIENSEQSPFEFSIPGFLQIFVANKSSFIDIAGIIRIGQGSQFEGIEILNGLILIGRNEYFDGIIIGKFQFGKKLSLKKDTAPHQNQALIETTQQQMNEDNYYAYATSNILSQNPELKAAAEDACKQIADIRAHCEEIIADDIKSTLNQTTSNLKEKLDREKRIMNEMERI